MVQVREIENLIRNYFEKENYGKCDAIYMMARLIDRYRILDNLRLRYGTEKYYDEVLEDLQNFLEPEHLGCGIISGRMKATNEEINKVIIDAFESIYAPTFKTLVKNRLKTLGNSGKKLAYLIYKKRDLMQDYDGNYRINLDAYDENPFRLLYNQSFDEKYPGIDALVKVGLIDKGQYHSRRG